MTEIRKYSKEWFATEATKRQKDVAKNLQKGDNGIFDKENFTGTREEVREKIKNLPLNIMSIINDKRLVQSFGGVDAVFDVLDSNGDGIVTPEEIDEVSAVDTKELAKELDTTLTSADLQKIYENAVGGEFADVTKTDDVEFYVYKDGSRVKLDKNENGEVIQKMVMENTENGEVKVTKYNYETGERRETIQDNKHRIRLESVDNKGRANDKTTEIKYLSNGLKMTIERSAGKVVTTICNKDKKVLFKDEKLNFKINQKIENTNQQDIGECWVLSGVNALRDTKGGKKLIKDAITKNDDGTYTVELKGVERKYTYSADQVAAHDYANQYLHLSKGDSDMHLIEMAIMDFRKETVPEYPVSLLDEIEEMGYPTQRDPLNGGFINEAFEYLIERGPNIAHVVNTEGNEEDFFTIMNAKEVAQNVFAATASFKEDDEEFKDGTIIDGHAYSIKKIDPKFVYLVNPWDSSKVIKYPREKFEQNCRELCVCNTMYEG